MRKIKTTAQYSLDGHTLVELIVNHLKLPDGICGEFNISLPLSYIIKIDEEGGISLFRNPENRGDEPESIDLNKPRVFVSTEQVEIDDE